MKLASTAETCEGILAWCSVVGEALPGVLSSFKPDLVLYDAGCDPHEDDLLGKLALTDEGLMRRELLVRKGFHRMRACHRQCVEHVAFMRACFCSGPCRQACLELGAAQRTSWHACGRCWTPAWQLESQWLATWVAGTAAT